MVISLVNAITSVSSDLSATAINGDKTKTIDITIEEKPTGEIFAGAGTGTNGTTVSFGVRENNYLGKGILLSLIHIS